jgi:hypothetical protein
MMNLARRSFRRSMNMKTMKMAVWCPDYGDGRPLSHTYDNKPRSRRSYY